MSGHEVREYGGKLVPSFPPRVASGTAAGKGEARLPAGCLALGAQDLDGTGGGFMVLRRVVMLRWLLPGLGFILPGGALSLFGESARPLEGLSVEQRRGFEAGEVLFSTVWAEAPAVGGVRDGLGPFYHAASCADCHPGGGRGLSPDATVPGEGPVFRIGTREGEAPDEYGAQLSPLAVFGFDPEGSVAVKWTEERGKFADGVEWSLRVPEYRFENLRYGEISDDVRISARLAPAVFGMGLLEAVEQETLEAIADPYDEDGNGISGRLNLEETWVGANGADDVAGRFGWKAWMPTLLRQVCDALGEDMGLTNVFHFRDVMWAQSELIGEFARGRHGGVYEAGQQDTRALVAYLRWLAPPARREVGDLAVVEKGRGVFDSAGCADCHMPELKTGRAGGAEILQERRVAAYSDLLLHDMGEGLADGRAEAKAGGSEWRTAPLWGLGLAVDDEGAGFLLHDGRARSLEEAILWHGGEGAKSRDAFMVMGAEERAALVAFLRSL